ncbi:uncharacterized protein EI90DRAFT_455658 [Cantharellus anzutake]|uniref:uncharacterized protein n=1 Tax=Cantharellus anzutake TaxID=1750568 RepID=UPI001908907D|nr:uncharacterized protein EI90DRAFT_455658 [Cantharellus anzutake]KAF8334713.1 hypothetical protein EI90DRAFT_455658 [Cantharellus anzutake]
MVTPPHPEDDWLSIAAIFVHFCRVASREDRPKTVHIIWQTANEQRFPARKRPLILVDEVIKAAQATSAHPARDGNTAGPSPKGSVSVFRAQKIDELLDATTGGAWREWPLTMKPMSPRTPMTVRSFEERSIEAAFPHCRCSAMIPTFFAINQRRPVSALAFNFKNFHELLRQFKREEIHYSALCEAVLPACKACHRVMKQIGLDYTDVALSSTIPKELLASEYDLEDDVDEDYEVVDRNQSDSDERYDSPLTPSPSPPRNYEPYPSHPPAHPQNQSLSVLNPRYPHSPTQAPLPISKLYPPSPSPSPPKTLQAAPAEVPKSLKTPVVNRSWMRSSPVASQQLTETITAKGRKVAPLIMPPPPLPHGNGANNRPSSPQPQVPQAQAQAPPKSSAAKRHPNGTVSPPSSPSPPPNVVQQQQAQARQTAHYPWFLFPTSFTQQQALAYPHHFRQQPAPASPQRMAQQPYDMKMMLPTQFMHAQPSAAYAQRGASAQQQEWQEQQPSQPPRPQNRARYAYSVAPTSGPLQFMPAPPDHQAYFTHALALVPVGHGSRPHPVPPLPTAVPPLTVEPRKSYRPPQQLPFHLCQWKALHP